MVKLVQSNSIMGHGFGKLITREIQGGRIGISYGRSINKSCLYSGRGKINFCFSAVDNSVNLCRSIALGIVEFIQQYILLC